jgi:hypothetical protein
MLKSNLYKYLYGKLIMGAREALMLLSVLQRNGTLTRDHCVRHVLNALYQGPGILYGEPSYENAERAAYADVFRDRRLSRIANADAEVQDAAISSEAADYLRHILATAAGDRRGGLPASAGRFDGYSEEAFEEVRELLGRYGSRYLGISGQSESLRPAHGKVLAFAFDESYSESRELEGVTGPQVLMLDIQKGQPPDLFEEIKLLLDIPEHGSQSSNLRNAGSSGTGTYISDTSGNIRRYKAA